MGSPLRSGILPAPLGDPVGTLGRWDVGTWGVGRGAWGVGRGAWGKVFSFQCSVFSVQDSEQLFFSGLKPEH